MYPLCIYLLHPLQSVSAHHDSCKISLYPFTSDTRQVVAETGVMCEFLWLTPRGGPREFASSEIPCGHLHWAFNKLCNHFLCFIKLAIALHGPNRDCLLAASAISGRMEWPVSAQARTTYLPRIRVIEFDIALQYAVRQNESLSNPKQSIEGEVEAGSEKLSGTVTCCWSSKQSDALNVARCGPALRD